MQLLLWFLTDWHMFERKGYVGRRLPDRRVMGASKNGSVRLQQKVHLRSATLSSYSVRQELLLSVVFAEEPRDCGNRSSVSTHQWRFHEICQMDKTTTRRCPVAERCRRQSDEHSFYIHRNHHWLISSQHIILWGFLTKIVSSPLNKIPTLWKCISQRYIYCFLY